MKLKEIVYYVVILVFFGWCAVTFRADVAQIKFAPVWAAWDAVLLAGGLSLANYFLRIIRWTFYLSRLGHPLKFGFSALTYIVGFAFTLSPGKVGEMVRGRYLQKVGVPLSSTAAAFFIERLMDLLAMLALASLTVTTSAYRSLLWGALSVIAVMLCVLAGTPWLRVSAWLPSANVLPEKLRTLLQGLIRTLIAAKALLSPPVLVAGFVLGVISWGCEGLGLMAIAPITGSISMTMPVAVGIYAIAIIVGALSFLPGGLGSTEAVMVALLSAYGYSVPGAMLLTLVCRLLTLWLAVAIGWIAVFVLQPKKKNDVYLPMTTTSPTAPLCVDLDGTLILSDLLLETAILLIKRNPCYVFLLPIWLLRGKAQLKAEIAKRVTLNPAALPYNNAFLVWLESQRNAGRALWLCTASNHRLAQQVADHLGIFSGIVASSDDHNLSGRAKADKLVGLFGEKGFDYCGNHRVDLAIWQRSHNAIAVNCSGQLVKKAAAAAELYAAFPKTGHGLKAALKALRPHQWAKNVLIFVPLAAAHKLTDPLAAEQAILAFFAFSFCASSVYLLNDMLDLEADRLHPRKCKRPFASGQLPLLAGCVLIPMLLVAATLSSLSLPWLFWLALGGYYALTAAYSFFLKRIVLVDILTLAGLYTLRIIAGAMAVGVPLTFWLLLFSVFLFLSLALVKRYAELDNMQRQGKLKAAGRGYHIEDLAILQSLGTSSGYLCVLVLALYINSPAVTQLYRYPQAIWLLCIFLLYWISRVWLAAHRGKMHDDPVVFAMKDRISQLIGLLSAITVAVAI